MIQAGDEKENFFKVKKNGYWGVINEVGTVVVPLRYTGIAAKKDEMTTVNGVTLDYTLTLDEFGRKGWGYLSGNGFVQPIPCEYEHVDASGNGWVIDEICVEKVFGFVYGSGTALRFAGRLRRNACRAFYRTPETL